MKTDSRPTAEDVARRLVILKHVVVAGLVAPPRVVAQTHGRMEHTRAREVRRRRGT